VGHFRRSLLATTELEKAQIQLGLPRHKLLQDCATRWNLQVGLLKMLNINNFLFLSDHLDLVACTDDMTVFYPVCLIVFA